MPDNKPDILPDIPDILIFPDVRETGHSGHSPVRGCQDAGEHPRRTFFVRAAWS
jgi:hypothetical protein